jgi:hypothetical protein
MLHLKPNAIALQLNPAVDAFYDQARMLAAAGSRACKIKKMILKREKCRKLLIVNEGGSGGGY